MVMKNIVIGITGASGSIYAIDLLQKLRAIANVRTHVILSPWARQNIEIETDYQIKDIQNLADEMHQFKNLGASIASGSFKTDGMVIVPASMKTVAAISMGYSDNLITRAADVTIKEQRKLVLVPRETPLSVIHLENLTRLAKLGVQIIPPVPAFYNNPQTIQDIVEQQTMKILDAFGIQNEVGTRWEGMQHE